MTCDNAASYLNWIMMVFFIIQYLRERNAHAKTIASGWKKIEILEKQKDGHRDKQYELEERIALAMKILSGEEENE